MPYQWWPGAGPNPVQRLLPDPRSADTGAPASPPGSVPTVRAVATAATAATDTSLTVPLPPGWQPGDVCYLGVELTASTGTITTPAGWADVVAQFRSAASTSSATAVFRRILQPGDTDVTVTISSGRAAAISVAVAGADPTTPEDVAGAADDNTGVVFPDVQAPSVTTVTDNTLALVWFSARNGTNGATTDFTAPAGTNEEADVSSAVAAASNAAISVASQTITPAGATGAQTATAASSSGTTVNGMGATVAVRPASGGGTPTAAQAGAAPVGFATSGTAGKAASLAGASPSGITTVGVGVHAGRSSGTAPVGLAASGTARKVVAVSGRCPVGFTARGTAARRQAQAATAPLGAAVTGQAVKRAPQTAAAPLGVTGAGQAVRLAAQAGRVPAGFTTWRTTAVVPRALEGRLVVPVGTYGTARKTTTGQGAAPLAAVTRGTPRRIARPAGAALVAAVTGASAYVRRAPQTGAAFLSLAGFGDATIPADAAARYGLDGTATGSGADSPTAAATGTVAGTTVPALSGEAGQAGSGGADSGGDAAVSTFG